MKTSGHKKFFIGLAAGISTMAFAVSMPSFAQAQNAPEDVSLEELFGLLPPENSQTATQPRAPQQQQQAKPAQPAPQPNTNAQAPTPSLEELFGLPAASPTTTAQQAAPAPAAQPTSPAPQTAQPMLDLEDLFNNLPPEAPAAEASSSPAVEPVATPEPQKAAQPAAPAPLTPTADTQPQAAPDAPVDSLEALFGLPPQTAPTAVAEPTPAPAATPDARPANETVIPMDMQKLFDMPHLRDQQPTAKPAPTVAETPQPTPAPEKAPQNVAAAPAPLPALSPQKPQTLEPQPAMPSVVAATMPQGVLPSQTVVEYLPPVAMPEPAPITEQASPAIALEATETPPARRRLPSEYGIAQPAPATSPTAIAELPAWLQESERELEQSVMRENQPNVPPSEILFEPLPPQAGMMAAPLEDPVMEMAEVAPPAPVSQTALLAFPAFSSSLPPRLQDELDMLASQIANGQSGTIEISGFANWTSNGSVQASKAIAHNRVKNVRDYLAMRGVPTNRIMVDAVGLDFKIGVPRDRVEIHFTA